MNLGIVTSYIIGGMLLLSLLFFNNTFQSHTQEMTIAAITNQQMNDLVTLITHDINRIGYQYNHIPMTTMSSDKLVFFGDIYDEDSFNATKVTWSWGTPTDPVTSTKNPRDFYLTREGPTSSGTSNGTIKIPVTYFNLRYLNIDGVQVTEVYSVKEIEMELIIESAEPYLVRKDGTELYYKVVYKRSFFPTNLNKGYY